MTNQDRLRVRTVFAQAADLPQCDRGPFLDAACRDEPALRVEVEELLAYDLGLKTEADHGGFLKSPLIREHDGPLLDPSSLPQKREPGLKAQIGRYRILRRHGEGGMGTVYEAEQDNPRRIVALKVIRPGLVSPEILSRFSHETQILGRLQHPGIPQIYEAAMGDDGEPFFAMEFIHGIALDAYARGLELDPAARLELLAKICDAVQHAHDKGIIHRDLKPGNILVDASGQPKLLDFGVAHVTDADLLATSSRTQTGQLLGTLNYMSPEQLTARPSVLDGRSDVYTLGVILFELLAERPPYHLGALPMHEVARVVTRQEPPRLGLLDRRYRGDVEIIVSRAMAKEKTRRYGSAGSLASDIRRHLRGQPIQARQIGITERSWRWARLNPSIAVLGGVLAGVLILATVGSLLAAGRFARLASREHDSAIAERVARFDADRQSKVAETARAAAQAETYRAMLSEVKALRAGHQLGWRQEALGNLARLAVMPTPRRDLVELRTEAVASLGEFGVKEVARFELADAGQTMTLQFHPDSRTLVTTNRAGDLRFWDIPGRTLARRLDGVATQRHNFSRDANGGLARFLADGTLAYLAANQGVSFLGKVERRPIGPPQGRGGAETVKLDVDRRGRWLAVGRDDNRIDLYDAGTGEPQRGFDRDWWDFILSPDGRWLGIQDRDGKIEFLSTDGEGSPFTLVQGHGYFPAIAFCPDGSTLACVDGRNVILWDFASKRELLTLGGHKESITAIAFSPDGALVATTCGDSMTRIWDARDGRALAVLPGPWYMRTLAFSPDGEYLAAGADPGAVVLYQIDGRREQRRLVGHTFGSLSVASHPNKSRLVSSADDNCLVVWDLDNARPLRRWVAGNDERGLVYSPDGSRIFSGTGDFAGRPLDEIHTLVRIWDAENGTEQPPLQGQGADVSALAFDPKGLRLASGDKAGTVLLWEIPDRRILRRESVGNSPVTSVVFLDGGRQLLVGAEAGDVVVFDLEKSTPPRRIRLPDGCRRLVFDPRTNRAIVGNSNGAILAVSLPELTVVHRAAKGHDGAIAALALMPDNRLLVSSGMDRRVVLRDAMSFEALLTFPAWTGVVRDMTFDATGRRLAFAGVDSDVSLWDLGLVHDELAALGLAWDRDNGTKAIFKADILTKPRGLPIPK